MFRFIRMGLLTKIIEFCIKLMSESMIHTALHIIHRVITYLLTPWSRVLLEKLTGSAASQEIPPIFGTRRFLTVLTSARHLPLSRANSIQFSQHPPTSRRSILILSSHLSLGLPNGLFPSGFPTRTLCTRLPSPISATSGNYVLKIRATIKLL